MSESDPPSAARDTEQSILASLPNTRPQHASARRAAARKRAAATSERTAVPSGRVASAPRHTSARSVARAHTRQKQRDTQTPAPRQGFEADSEPQQQQQQQQTGRPISPPSSAELAGSIVELLGELAQNGLTQAGRLLREALGRELR